MNTTLGGGPIQPRLGAKEANVRKRTPIRDGAADSTAAHVGGRAREATSVPCATRSHSLAHTARTSPVAQVAGQYAVLLVAKLRPHCLHIVLETQKNAV